MTKHIITIEFTTNEPLDDDEIDQAILAMTVQLEDLNISSLETKKEVK